MSKTLAELQPLSNNMLFINKADSRILDSSVDGLCKLHREDFHFGVEVELEMAPVFGTTINTTSPIQKVLYHATELGSMASKVSAIKLAIFNELWKTTTDGSLRGENSREFVFHKPYKGKVLQFALHSLEDTLSSITDKYLPSPRCSVHVHMNVLDMTPREYFMLLLLYVIFEQVLFSFCGRGRRDSVYCVPVSYSSQTQAILAAALHSVNNIPDSMEDTQYNIIDKVFGKWPKYSAINIGGDKKCGGTVEFRHLPSTISAEVITNWINLLSTLKVAAINLTQAGWSYGSIVEKALSDPSIFAENVLAGDFDKMYSCSGMEDLWEGARCAARLYNQINGWMEI